MSERRWPEDPDGEIAITLRCFRALQEGCEERDAEREQHALWRGRYEAAKEEVERLRKSLRAATCLANNVVAAQRDAAIKRAEAAEAECDALRRKLDAVVPLLRAAHGWAEWNFEKARTLGGAWRALPADVRALADGGDDD